MRYPVLSFIELQRLAPRLNAALSGAKIDRIFIPECPGHPHGFFKNEWVLETRHSQILLSLRAQACGLTVHSPKTFRPAKEGTRSGFDLNLSKTLEGTRIESVESISGERALWIRFLGISNPTLTLMLIPAKPTGELNRKEKPLAKAIQPDVQPSIPDRQDLTENLESYSALWLQCRIEEATRLKQQKLRSGLEQQVQALTKKKKSLEQQLKQSLEEPDWNRYGKLLQMNLFQNPKLVEDHYELEEFESGITHKIPGDRKLNTKEQLEKYFHQAKRKKKKIEEAESRIADIIRQLEPLQSQLSQIEQGLGPEETGLHETLKTESKHKSLPRFQGYAGRAFQSKEGLTILSGRSKDENLELTFKIARGNDLWLHVKGRPGSHTVIFIPPGKNASLDTLLDAANLCILHSGGKDWGKTEVDYTQRKNVKKIKNQTEVSYSQNKTLVVNLDPDRIERLYRG